MDISQPSNQDLKDPNMDYQEFRQQFSDELPEEVIDVGDLNKAEAMKQMERYAILASSSYETYKHGSDKSETMIQKLLPNYTIDKNLSNDLSTTIVNVKADGTRDVIISYRGTQTLTDIGVDVFQIATGSPIEKLGGIPIGRFKTSQNKYDAVKLTYPNANITTTGHSLGSSIANYIGKTNNIKSYGFNSGSSPLDLITKMSIKNSPENQFTHYYTAGDAVGLSSAVIGSADDKLVLIPPHKWIQNFSSTVATGLAGSLVSGPIGASIGFSVGSLASLIDIHGLHNFLPSESFKGTLEKYDIAYRWVKPIHHHIKNDTMISSKGRLNNLKNDEPIIINEFIQNLNKFKCKNKLFKCYQQEAKIVNF
jgi:hypothetical protein